MAAKSAPAGSAVSSVAKGLPSASSRQAAIATASARQQSNIDEGRLESLYESVQRGNFERDRKAFDIQSRHDKDMAKIQGESRVDEAFAGASGGSRAANVEGSWKTEQMKLQNQHEKDMWNMNTPFQEKMANQSADFSRQKDSADRQFQRDMAARKSSDLMQSESAGTSRSLASNASNERIAAMNSSNQRRRDDQQFELGIHGIDLGRYQTFMPLAKGTNPSYWN